MSDDTLADLSIINRRNLLRTVGGVAAFGVTATLNSKGAVAEPGKQQWAFETGGAVRSSPTVAGNTVVVGSGDGKLYAIDVDTGDKVWAYDTTTEFEPSNDNTGNSIGRASNTLNINGIFRTPVPPTPEVEISGSPTVADETVFVGSGDIYSREEYGGGLIAVDIETGEPQWTFDTELLIWSSPTVAEGTVFVGCRDNNLYAVDAETGDQQWAFETDAPVRSSPTVEDGTVFVGSDDSNLYAVDTESGNQQWAFETERVIHSSPTVMDGTVFVGCDDHNLHALDADTGDQRWISETNDSILSSPTVADGTVFVGSGKPYSDETNLYAIAAETGDQQWAFETNGGVYSSPTIADGTVYVGSYDNNIYALDASSGDEQWRFETESSVQSSPTVVDGTVFVGSMDTKLYALDADTTGSSDGSRVRLQTLGHHTDTSETRNTVSIPGFGIGSGITAIGATSYLLKRRLTENSK